MLTKTKKRPKKGTAAKRFPVSAGNERREQSAKAIRPRSISIGIPKSLRVSAVILLSEELGERMKSLGWKVDWVLNAKAAVGYGPTRGGSTARYPNQDTAVDAAVESLMTEIDHLIEAVAEAAKRHQLIQARGCIARFHWSRGHSGGPDAEGSRLERAKKAEVIRLEAPPSSTALVPVLPDPPLSAPLSSKESRRLEVCEGQIERNLRAFFEVGRALTTIRQERLYRATHGSFDAYCQSRWDFQRAYAYRLIDAAEVVDDIATSPIGDKLPPPANEAQVRALAKVERTQRAEVWQQAVERAPRDAEGNPCVTAEIVAHAVHRWITPDDELDAEKERVSRAEPPEDDEDTAAQFERSLTHLRDTVRGVALLWQDDDQVEAILATLRALVAEFSVIR